MRQKLFFQFILLLILTLGYVFGIHYFAQATTGVAVDVYVDGILLDHENPIFQETNWTPGDSITKTVELRNLTDKSFNVDLVITEQPSGILAEKLKITITSLNKSFNYGPKTLKTFFSDSPLSLPNINASATDSYEFKVEFPIATNVEDNKYNYNDKNALHYEDGDRCNTIFDLNFGFNEITTTITSSSGGEGPEWFWQNMNLGASGIVGAVETATSPIIKAAQTVKLLPTKLPRVGAWNALIAASMGLIATAAFYRRNKK